MIIIIFTNYGISYEDERYSLWNIVHGIVVALCGTDGSYACDEHSITMLHP